MKTPPTITVPRRPAVPAERDRRFLIFVGILLAGTAFALKSEMVGSRQLWAISLALLFAGCGSVFAYLRYRGGRPSVEHFIGVGLGVLAVSGLSTLVADYWRFALIVAFFGIAFVITAQLDYRRLRNQEKPGHLVLQEAALILAVSGGYLVLLATAIDQPPRLAGIFLVGTLAAYRYFRVVGTTIPPGRSLFFSLIVGQVVTLLAAMVGFYEATVGEGLFAVMLVLAWYVNRGLIRHGIEENFTLQVILEYAGASALLVYLFLANYQTAR